MYDTRNAVSNRAACLLLMSKAIRTALRTLMIARRSIWLSRFMQKRSRRVEYFVSLVYSSCTSGQRSLEDANLLISCTSEPDALVPLLLTTIIVFIGSNWQNWLFLSKTWLLNVLNLRSPTFMTPYCCWSHSFIRFVCHVVNSYPTKLTWIRGSLPLRPTKHQKIWSRCCAKEKLGENRWVIFILRSNRRWWTSKSCCD